MVKLSTVSASPRPKSDHTGSLGQEAVDRIKFANELLTLHHGNEFEHRFPIGCSSHREARPSGGACRQVVFIIRKRKPTSRPHDQVHLTHVAEIGGDRSTPIAIVVGTGEVADIEKVFPLHIPERPLPLKSTKVMSLLDDFPRVANPEFTQGIVQFPGCGNITTAIARL